MQVGRTRLLVLVLVGGCYGYYPPASAAPVRNTQIAVTLTDSGSAVLARSLGPASEIVEGRLLSDSANAFAMALTSVRQHNGTETSWRGERVVIGRGLIAHVEERRFSRSRTALAAALVSAALVAAVEGFKGNGGAKLPGTPPPGGNPK